MKSPVKYDQPKDGFDRTPVKARPLYIINKEGKLVKDLKLGEGEMYYPGGIAFDRKSIWVPVAEYRPNSKSIIYKVNPEKMNAQEVFRTNDHIGGILRDEKKGTLKAVSWGSRTFYEFNEKGKVLQKSNNLAIYRLSGCENAVKDNMICSGITELQGRTINC